MELISPYRPEAEVGRRDGGQVGDKAGDETGLRTGTWVCNLRKHRTQMPLLQSLLKTRQNNRKNRRKNNAETVKQYNRPAALPI
jgi:hypothetical protein